MTSPPPTPRQVLWTGGWDSSFRVMQSLLVDQVPVQPIYVLNPARRSNPNELRAMGWMRRQLLARLIQPELLAPLQILNKPDFPRLPHLEALQAQIRQRTTIGDQYVTLGSVAEVLGWQGVELSMESREDTPDGMNDMNRLVFKSMHGGALTDAPEAALFKYWSFPVLHMTKSQMASVAKEHGFYDLLVRRWFCHRPVSGKACGACNPCKLANRDGVAWANPVVSAGVRGGRRAAFKVRKLVRG